MLHVLAANDQSPPQFHHVDGRPEDTPEIEELRLAMGAMVMVDRRFRDTESRVLEFLHHLQADDAAVLLEPDHVEDSAAHQSKIAIDVANLQTEEQLDRV